MTPILSATLAVSSVFLLQDPQEPQQDTGGWVTDYAAAKAQAAEEGKDLLIDFTGSDWCVWCQRLKSEVFDEQLFQDEASKHFVFVELDFPQDKSGQSEEEIAQNEKLMAEFGVAGFPTIFLCDGEGRPYGQTGYQRGGAEAYIEHLAELRGSKTKRDEALGKADEAEGEERAAFLAEAIDALDEELHSHYRAWIEEVVATGSPELKERFQKRLRQMELESRLQETQELIGKHAEEGDWDGAIGVVDGLLAEAGEDLEPPIRQQLLVLKGRLCLEKDDVDAALAALRSAKEIDPEGQLGQGIQRMIEQVEERAEESEDGDEEGEEDSDGEHGEGENPGHDG